MTTYDAIADAFGFGQIRNYDWLTLGKVTAVNGTKLKVLIGGSSVPADCEAYCPAIVGDVVLVVVMKGQAKAVAVKGGGDFLPLSGGTLTGQLNGTTADFSGNVDSNGTFVSHDEYELDQADNGVSSIIYPSLAVGRDADGRQASSVHEVVNPNGNLSVGLNVFQYDTSGNQVGYNGIEVGLDKNGNRYYDITDPRKMREAIHVNAWGQLSGQSGNLNLSTSWQKVPLSSFSGQGCSASSNGIKVSQGGTYWVQGSIYIATGCNAGDLIHVGIYKNSSLINEGLKHAPYANPYETFDVPPVILSLAANDVVYIYAYNQNAARGIAASRSNIGLFLHQLG